MSIGETPLRERLRPPAFIAAVYLTALAGVWTIDVIVNLRLVGHVLHPDTFIGSPRNFLGLLLTDALAAALLGTFALLFGVLISRLPRMFPARTESVLLLAAVLAAAAVPVRMVFPSRFTHVEALIAGLAAAAGTWILLRLWLRRVADHAWLPRRIMAVGLYLPTMAGLATSILVLTALERSGRGLDALGLLILGLLGLLLVRIRHAGLRRLLACIPPAVATALVVVFCVASARYGEPRALRAAGVMTAADTVAVGEQVTGASGVGSGVAHGEGGAQVAMASDVQATVAGNGQIAVEGNGQAAVEGAGPTIVLIVLDTVRADHLQRYGYFRNTMPALERWAEEGWIATRAVSPAGWTTPAHASIFSGRTVSRHGAHYNRRHRKFKTLPVDGLAWLPALLAQRGYGCLAVTANQLAMPGVAIGFHRVLAPAHQGFERTLGAVGDRLIPMLARLSEALTWRVPYVDAREVTDLVMRAVPAAEVPLFLYVNYLDAHSPYTPPPQALDDLEIRPLNTFSRYTKHRRLTLLWDELPDERARYLNDLYDAELRWIDRHLARLLDWIPERFGEETIVIVTSDHGEELGEEGRIGHEYGLDQRLLHVPLFIRGPGVCRERNNEILTLRRLYDFVLHLGSGAPPALDLLTTRDEFGTLAERYPSRGAITFVDPRYQRPWVAEFSGPYKAVGPSSSDMRVFDIEASGFRDAPAVEDSALARPLRETIDRYWETHQDRRTGREQEQGPTEEELERLRSLGYIQ
ncbi:MAG: sulfatase [Candidatus Eisenbacteria sp.]|nr:sulfatase [Candidatus Eisenbacteria bacterium]